MTAFLTHVSSVIIAFVTIAVFLHLEDDNEQPLKFTTGRVFAALALFNQLTVPLFIFPITIPIIISAIVSTRRLERFLHQPEVQKEFEGIRNMARVMSRSDASLDVFEIDEYDPNGNDDSQLMDTPIPSPMLDPGDAQYALDASAPGDFFFREIQPLELNANGEQRNQTVSVKLKKCSQISMSARMDRNRPHQKSLTRRAQLEISNDLVISIRNGEFTWHGNGNDACLRVNRLDVPKGNPISVRILLFDCASGKCRKFDFPSASFGLGPSVLPLIM